MKKRYLVLLSACTILAFIVGNESAGAMNWDSPITAYAKTDKFEFVKKRPGKEEISQVQFALKELKKAWKEEYENDIYKKGSGYLEIKNTRLVEIKEDNDTELFEDVDYIVEFTLFSNYFDSAPYYANCGVKDCVVVYEDGSVTLQNLISIYRSRTYSSDFTGFIERVCDFDNAFNEVMILN